MYSLANSWKTVRAFGRIGLLKAQPFTSSQVYWGTLRILIPIPGEDAFTTLKSESISDAWRRKAQAGGFDEDLCIVDPEAHYNILDHLKEMVISKSEFERCRGRYDVFDENPQLERFRYKDVPHTIPSWLETYSQSFMQKPMATMDEGYSARLKLIGSIWISYSILRTVLTSFSFLEEADFCKNHFFSVLVEREANVTEIVKIFPKQQLNKMKIDLENLFGHIMESETLEGFERYIFDLVEEPCLNFWSSLGFDFLKAPASTTSTLTKLRTTVLFLDLAMVSYASSHGSRFDQQFELNSDRISVFGQLDEFGFDYALRSFACLDKFLDSRPVWTFKLLGGAATERKPQLQPVRGMQLLTTMDAFADLWGPVWSIPANEGHGIKQYNVSKGAICPINDKRKPRTDSAILCHWYTWAEFRRQKLSRLFKATEEKVLAPNDLLLIGGLRTNDSCNYTLGDFENDFEADIDVMGTNPEAWRLDTRSAGMSFSKIIGVSVMGTQKRLPQTTLKQLILDRWSNAPKRANPGVLNMYLGLEISHCTGNSRRVSLKSLLLIDSVQPLLERQIPGWKLSDWGRSFLVALSYPDPQAIFNVWTYQVGAREQMAELVCSVLEILDTTGFSHDRFTADFFHENQELSVKLDHKSDSWSVLLQDSHLMAVFPIVNKNCLECHTPDHSAATCNTHWLPSVLQTQIAVDSSEVFKWIVLEPYRQALRKINDGTNRIHLFIVENSVTKLFFSIGLALSKNSVTGKEKRNQSLDQSYSMLICGSTANHQRSTPRTIRAEDDTSRQRQSSANITNGSGQQPVTNTPGATATQVPPVRNVLNIPQEPIPRVEPMDERNDLERILELREWGIDDEFVARQLLVEDFYESRNIQQAPAVARREHNGLVNDLGAYQLSEDSDSMEEDDGSGINDTANSHCARLAEDIPAAPYPVLRRAAQRQHRIADNIDEYYISDHDFEDGL